MVITGRMKYILALILLLLCYFCKAQGNFKDYCFKQISTEQGLSQSTVLCILNDHNGTIWIGTKNGLNKFTQYELISYYHQGSANSLPDNYINFIAEDACYNIWIGTSKGLVIYDREYDNFIPVLLDNKSVPVYSFHCDADGIIFGGFGESYFYRYKTKQLEKLALRNNLPQIEYNHILRWTKNKLILASRYDGIYVYDTEKQMLEEISFIKKKDITAIYVDKCGQLWLSPYEQGLFCFNSEGQQVLHIKQNNSKLTNDIILDIIERDGKIWVATDGGGINIYNQENGEIEVIREEPGNSYSLPENSILCLYNDADNTLWAGSIRGGLLRIKEVFIRTYKNVPLNVPYGLSNEVVVSLFEDTDKTLWIGTDGGGINSYNPNVRKFTHHLGTYSNKVVSITGYSQNELLVSLFGKGLYLFNKKTSQLTPFLLVDPVINAEECLAGSSVYLDQCMQDKILILGKDIYIYDKLSKTFSTTDNVDIYYRKLLQKITTGDSIAYLLGQYHILKLDCNTGKSEVVYDNHGSLNLVSAAYNGKDIIWIGTYEGLYQFDLSDHTMKKIETALFHSVSSLRYDDRGRLWVGAQNMLFCYFPVENKFIILGESDGAYPNELFPMTLYKSDSNTLYLGGNNGLICINEDIVFESDVLPVVRLVDVVVNGVSRLSEVNRSDESSITVPWNTNSIEIKLDTKETDVFRKKIFKYNIIGINNQYVESYNHSLNLVSLSPGDYTIMVSCSSQNGSWSTPVSILHISVIPPIWKTGWFIGGCVLCGIFLVIFIAYMIIRKNKNQLKWKMKEHEKEVDEEKIRFLINVSHELRTPLTLVYAPLKRILERENIGNPDLKRELFGIFKCARQMKEMINMVLDVRRMEVGQDSLRLESHNLNQWINDIGNDFLNEFSAKNIRIDYHFDNDISEVSFDRTKCEIVLSNLLMNALKYSVPDTLVTISTCFLREEQMVRVAVSDQGIGLEDVDSNKLFTRFYRGNFERSGSGIGLSYSKVLIEMHKGRIGAFDNGEAPGATFYFDLPCLQGMTTVINCQPKPYLNELLHLEDPVKSEPETSGAKKYSVLIVEDNLDMNKFLQEILQEHFLHVYAAMDGCEAMEVIRNRMPDIIVSDVMMPKMDGFELCQTVKNDLDISHIPIVLLTARNDTESNMLGYKMGADAYLPKPFETELLVTVLKNILKNREKIKLRYRDSSLLPTAQESTISNVDERFLLKLNKLICDNIDNPELDVKFLTDNMAMSRASLYNKVRALTDMGVNDYINKFRIDKAIDLLLNTDLSITEISEQAGFSYQRYFSSVFKQAKGVTPSQFRQNAQEEKEKR